MHLAIFLIKFYWLLEKCRFIFTRSNSLTRFKNCIICQKKHYLSAATIIWSHVNAVSDKVFTGIYSTFYLTAVPSWSPDPQISLAIIKHGSRRKRINLKYWLKRTIPSQMGITIICQGWRQTLNLPELLHQTFLPRHLRKKLRSSAMMSLFLLHP